MEMNGKKRLLKKWAVIVALYMRTSLLSMQKEVCQMSRI